ncbi:NAD(+) diphosphatase [Mangrovicoccus algicola]|uniref:NAD(+) diphosphatase n=1 Tax=Mangrovicoccus algicola TaxID=2771008 RepID=A0A8J6YT97_9RHOB|nr:NAD(+) diphosphatase [Mangrovicoccus algicola]MBE3637225.1 NAD(+) diphosphatase [Mangrovicoccus algicola]
MKSYCFEGSDLDRAAHLRGEAAGLLRRAEARVLPLWRGKVLVAGDPADRLGWLHPQAPGLAPAGAAMIFLGLSGGAPVFACDLPDWQAADAQAEGFDRFADLSEQAHPLFPSGTRFAELRAVMTRLGPREAEIAALARALTQWHGTHGFCARCGTGSAMAAGGWTRRCPACGAEHYPRTDPVVIMLVTRGNRVLLGRNAPWPPGMYSLLAGFVEPGETPEAAVRREVLEEAGIRVGAVRYLASQPWPFPTQLMTAWTAEALDEEITLDPEELEDARWISREELAQAFRGAHPLIAPARPGAIARAVLDHWLADRLDLLSPGPTLPPAA